MAAILLGQVTQISVGFVLLFLLAAGLNWLVLRENSEPQQGKAMPMKTTQNKSVRKSKLIAVSFVMTTWAVLTGHLGNLLP